MKQNIRNIAVLGSTGSIGRQTLDIIAQYPQLFKAWLLVANSSADRLIEQAIKFTPKYVIIANDAFYPKVSQALAHTSTTVLAGSKAIAEMVVSPEVHLVITAMVGYSGLEPTIAAIKAGKDIALANKETLVVAGDLIMELSHQHHTHIYPVDSEHGAFYQCLVGENRSDIAKLILTASGGPFRTWSRDRIAQATAADALKHPNWTMGAKITIDSATMMNKGFEMIEAKWLFGVGEDRIQVVVHPQSIVHSAVEFVDGSVKAQMGLPDMHLPIRYAMGLPSRLPSADRRLTIADYAHLTFEEPDCERFPLLAAAFDAARRGGNVPCAMNAANEIANAAYRQGKIKFYDLSDVVTRSMQWVTYVAKPTYADYVHTNHEVRNYAQSLICNL